MDMASNIILGVLSSGLSNRLGKFIDKAHVRRIMSQLQKIVDANSLFNYQNETYFNDLDGYITKNSIVDTLVRICYCKNDSAFQTLNDFSESHVEKFINLHGCHRGQRGIVKEILGKMYKPIDSAINNCDFSEETRIITNEIALKAEEQLQKSDEILEEIKRIQTTGTSQANVRDVSIGSNQTIVEMSQVITTQQNVIHELNTVTDNLLDEKYNQLI